MSEALTLDPVCLVSWYKFELSITMFVCVNVSIVLPVLFFSFFFLTVNYYRYESMIWCIWRIKKSVWLSWNWIYQTVILKFLTGHQQSCEKSEQQLKYLCIVVCVWLYWNHIKIMCVFQKLQILFRYSFI